MAALYRLEQLGQVVRVADNAMISPDPRHPDRIAFDRWIAQGNAPDPFVEDATVAAAKARQATLDADAARADLLTRLRSATPAQLNAYVDAQVTDLASARTMLKRILLVLAQT